MSNKPAKPKAVVLDGYTLNPGDNPWSALEQLTDLTVHEHTVADEILAHCEGCPIVLTNKTPLSAETIAALPDLQFIGVLATGYNVIDISAAKERGIVVANVPSYATETVAQHTMALLLELCHRCGAHSVSVHRGDWTVCRDFSYWNYPLIELQGKQLGIVGYGSIGRAVARIAEALGMHVRYFSRHNEADGETFLALDTLLSSSDVVSLHCALTPASERMINAESLKTMKSSAFLLNTGRGQLIDESALAEALKKDVIAGAGLDVLTREPPAASPLFGLDNCLITPHMAWSGLEARKRLMDTTVDNVTGFLSGTPQNQVS